MSEVDKVRPLTEKMAEANANVENDEVEIDLLELLYRLIDRWKLIFGMALLGMLIAVGITWFILTPQYEATAKLYVLNANDSAVNLSDLQIGSYLTTDYQEVFKTWEVHEMVSSNLGLSYTYAELQNMLVINNPSGTRILYITIRSENPAEAAALANEYAAVAKKYISETMATERPNNLSVALEPTKPVSPNKTLNIILGFVIGAFIAIVVVTILFLMDDKIRTAEDIFKYTNMPTLAMIPAAKELTPQAGSKRRNV